jgi:hypothetical protein
VRSWGHGGGRLDTVPTKTPSLLLPLAIVVADAPPVGALAERTYYFLAELTPAEARGLEGTRARFRMVLDSLEDEANHNFDCVAAAGMHASVLQRLGQEAADAMPVEAKLWVIDFPPGLGFPPLREYPLVDAVRVGP